MYFFLMFESWTLDQLFPLCQSMRSFYIKLLKKMMNTYIMVNVYSQEVLCDFNSIKTDNMDLYMVILAENYKSNMNSCLQID